MNEDEADLPHPPIVAFPSVETQFQMNFGTEDATIPTHETARCFDYGVSLQCADQTKSGFMPVEIFKHHLSSNLQKRTSQCQRYFLFKYTNEIAMHICNGLLFTGQDLNLVCYGKVSLFNKNCFYFLF